MSVQKKFIRIDDDGVVRAYVETVHQVYPLTEFVNMMSEKASIKSIWFPSKMVPGSKSYAIKKFIVKDGIQHFYVLAAPGCKHLIIKSLGTWGNGNNGILSLPYSLFIIRIKDGAFLSSETTFVMTKTEDISDDTEFFIPPFPNNNEVQKACLGPMPIDFNLTLDAKINLFIKLFYAFQFNSDWANAFQNNYVSTFLSKNDIRLTDEIRATNVYYNWWWENSASDPDFWEKMELVPVNTDVKNKIIGINI